jgi:general secretion pathway protein G
MIARICMLFAFIFFSCEEQIEKIDWTRRQVTRINMTQIENAIEVFKTTYRRLPESMDELLKPPPIAGGVTPAGFLSQIPKDGWGNKIIYQLDSTSKKGYVLISYGADGKPGGMGNDEDMTNEQL